MMPVNRRGMKHLQLVKNRTRFNWGPLTPMIEGAEDDCAARIGATGEDAEALSW